jgi:hypothetical protein
MLKANAPTQFTVPFANGASSSYKNVIPIPSQIGVTPGLASYTDGFPPVTMELPGAGGIPPYGQDMNGILYATTLAQLWAQSGFEYPFSSAFSTAIGGYPQNACLMMLTGKGFWLSAVDNNTSNPDTTGATGWFSVRANASSSSVAMAATGATTPDPSVLGVSALILTGAITANVTLVLPLASGANWIVENNTTGAFTVTVIGASGTGVAVATGSPAQVFTDGTNFYATTANVSGLYLPIGGNAVSASKLATARTITYTGGATGSFSFDGSSNVSCALTIGASGVTAGTYGSSTVIPQIVVGADGRITAVNNVTVSVPSVFGRTGAVVLTAADVNGLGALSLTGALSVAGSISATGASGQLNFNDQTTSLGWSLYATAGVANLANATTGPVLSFSVAGAAAFVSTVSTSGQYYQVTFGGNNYFFQANVASVSPSFGLASNNTAVPFIVSLGGSTQSLLLNSSGLALSSGQFIGNTSYAVLSTSGTSAGTVYLRPNGVSASTGQTTIGSTGNMVVAGTITPGSDARIKTNVVPITNALATVRVALVGVEYDRLDQGLAHQSGYIAQKVRKGLPHLVPITNTHGFRDFHSMDYNGALAYVSAALLELHDVVLAQQVELVTLKQQVR